MKMLIEKDRLLRQVAGGLQLGTKLQPPLRIHVEQSNCGATHWRSTDDFRVFKPKMV
jgi:hypothetical protein